MISHYQQNLQKSCSNFFKFSKKCHSFKGKEYNYAVLRFVATYRVVYPCAPPPPPP